MYTTTAQSSPCIFTLRIFSSLAAAEDLLVLITAMFFWVWSSTDVALDSASVNCAATLSAMVRAIGFVRLNTNPCCGRKTSVVWELGGAFFLSTSVHPSSR